ALELLQDVPIAVTYSERAMIGAIRADAHAALGDYERAYWCRRDHELGVRHGQLDAVEQAELRVVLLASSYGYRDDAIEARHRKLRGALDERTNLTTLVAKDLRGPIFSVGLAAELLKSSRTPL